jgi:hypothetical protein
VACSRSEAIDRRSIGLGNDLATRSRRTLGVQKVVGYSDGNDSASSFEVEAPRPCEPTSQAFLQQKARNLIVSNIEFSKLRISRAYIKLLCIPEGDAKIVSLAHIGNCEVRMLESPQGGFDATPLFSIELFDRDTQSPVHSRICYSLEEGVAAFQDFISH